MHPGASFPCPARGGSSSRLCSFKSLLPGASHESPARACSHPCASSMEAPPLPLPSLSIGGPLPASWRSACTCHAQEPPAHASLMTPALTPLSTPHTSLGNLVTLRHNPCLKCPTARRTDRCAGFCSHPGWKCSRECRCPGTRGGGLSRESRAQGAEELSSRKRGRGGILQDVVRFPNGYTGCGCSRRRERGTPGYLGELLAV